jgi:hypothetical protein
MPTRRSDGATDPARPTRNRTNGHPTVSTRAASARNATSSPNVADVSLESTMHPTHAMSER